MSLLTKIGRGIWLAISKQSTKSLILVRDNNGSKGLGYGIPRYMETKSLLWIQPRPTSKLLSFRRQWIPPAASPTIADGSIIILDVGLGFFKKRLILDFTEISSRILENPQLIVRYSSKIVTTSRVYDFAKIVRKGAYENLITLAKDCMYSSGHISKKIKHGGDKIYNVMKLFEKGRMTAINFVIQ